MNKNFLSLKLCTIAFGVVLNFIGAAIALSFRLPIYLDTIGTILTAALLGPFYGLIPGLLSGILGFFTTDIYSLYYTPVQMLTGFLSGFIFHSIFIKKWKLPIGVFLITLPGTILSSLITVKLFGGITSSSSSIIVQFLHKIGLDLTTSVFFVQILTDYFDRFITVAGICLLLAALPADLKNKFYNTQFQLKNKKEK